jgi:hypothetical protein
MARAQLMRVSARGATVALNVGAGVSATADIRKNRYHHRGCPGDLYDWGDCVADKVVNSMVNCEIRYTAYWWKQIQWHSGTVRCYRDDQR